LLVLFTAPEVLPFSVAFALLVGLGVLELFGLLFSASPTHAVEHSLSHFLPHVDHADATGGVLGWLHLGRVPMLVLLLLFLSAFAVGGYAFQWTVQSATGSFAPLWLAVCAAGAEAVAVVRVMGGVVAKRVPQDETSIVSAASFVGSAALITNAAELHGDASQASVLDAHGRKHFILVAAEGDALLADGMQVTVLEKTGARYLVKPLPFRPQA
jgi:hypothetical protein